MLEKIEGLARGVKAEWKAAGLSHDAFSEIAFRHLKASELEKNFEISEIQDWLAETRRDSFPHQPFPAGTFGQPPITLFYDKETRFFIDLYFWLIPETAIHDHGFCGACKVLQGKSLNICYSFDPERVLESRAVVGELKRTETTLFATGDTFKIDAGRRFIHQVWHLSHPTVSLVVRSMEFPEVHQQGYYAPFLCIPDHFYSSLTIVRRRFWEFEYRLDPAKGIALLNKLIASADLEGVMEAFVSFLTTRPEAGALEEVVAVISRRHGLSAKDIKAAAVHRFAQMQMIPDRTRDEGERFLMMALATLGAGDELYELIGQFQPGSPIVDLIQQWLQGLVFSRAMNRNLALFAYAMVEPGRKKAVSLPEYRRLEEKYTLSALEREVAVYCKYRELSHLVEAGGQRSKPVGKRGGLEAGLSL